MHINKTSSVLNQLSIISCLSIVMDLNRTIRTKISERISIGNDDSFYILDLSDVRLKYQKLIEKIPSVIPFYAIKCNDDPEILKTLAKLGTGFDCASKKELNQILWMGVQPHRIIYAHTVKQISHLQFAADNGVDLITFDSSAEVEKIKKFHPSAKLVLRIRYDAEKSMLCLGTKFGCDPITEAPELIKMCKDLKANLIGISFHVGTGTLDYGIYERALQAVRRLFNIAANFGFILNLVDIGGGFMGNINLLDNYAKYINRGIEKYFPDPFVTIISELGRYFSETAVVLVVQIIQKKLSKNGHMNYYINDSMYQSFMIAVILHINLQFKIIRKSEQSREPIISHPSTIWGQTCASNDIIIENRDIPELENGDFLVFENMGAYTMTVSTHFNGFKIGETMYTN